MLERVILRAFLVFGFVCLPFSLRKKPVKDWIIVFCSTGFLAPLIAKIVVKQKRLAFPIRFLPKYFNTHVLYEHLILPLFCVWFNQTTSRSKMGGMIGQALLYSGVHTVIEFVLERKTDLIIWKRWTCLHNIVSLTVIFLGSRGILFTSKWLSKKYDEEEIK
ncbi:hypothetical protein HNR44_002720 [Geomicrobium halophilum]|uniref:Uncharacterized protein n=1 Tax=Geomicrobium halophilum TaxID=549000 RepID=A0A841PPN3_9BACL|nr:CBO0543 family protein [Geomicrobium halophilum]MBB6450730.1 hypothetical protein [Geomicrobium halophilum]